MRFSSGLKLPKNVYHTKEFVLFISHFLRHGTTCFINPRLQRTRFFNARPGEVGQATSLGIIF